MKMLDLGVMGIIAPMINTKEDCENLFHIAITLLMTRSFGPMRAQLLHGSNYFKDANKIF